MDRLVGHIAQKLMGEGEKKAPLKSLKIKVKFQKAEGGRKEDAKKRLARRMK